MFPNLSFLYQIYAILSSALKLLTTELLWPFFVGLKAKLPTGLAKKDYI